MTPAFTKTIEKLRISVTELNYLNIVRKRNREKWPIVIFCRINYALIIYLSFVHSSFAISMLFVFLRSEIVRLSKR